VGPLKVEACLKSPANLNAHLGAVERGHTVGADDGEVWLWKAEGSAEELEILKRGGAPVGVDDDYRLTLTGYSLLMQLSDVVRGVNVARGVAVDEGRRANWGWGNAGRIGYRESRRVIWGDGDEWNELETDARG